MIVCLPERYTDYDETLTQAHTLSMLYMYNVDISPYRIHVHTRNYMHITCSPILHENLTIGLDRENSNIASR